MKLLNENAFVLINPDTGKRELNKHGYSSKWWTSVAPSFRQEPLTFDEQVDYLYEKALNGTAKEYREILDWIDYFVNMDQIKLVQFNFLFAHLDMVKDDIDHEVHAKLAIKRALEAELQYEQTLNQEKEHENY